MLGMPRLFLAEIHRRVVIEAGPLDGVTEAALRADLRPCAKAILNAVARRRGENRAEGQRLRQLLRYETVLWDGGVLHVAGVDEAGMSPLAGPVAAAAVVFAPGSRIRGIDDSKKLDAATRDRFAAEIRMSAAAWSVAFAKVEEIDAINIYWAGLLAMRRAVEGLSLMPQHLLLDARRIKDLSIPQQSIVKGDSRSLTIAAASILAKTAPGCAHAQAGYRVSGLWLCQAQGLSCPRASGRARAARGHAPSPPHLLTSSDGPWPAAVATMAEAG
jgi:ribonuclease HII